MRIESHLGTVGGGASGRGSPKVVASFGRGSVLNRMITGFNTDVEHRGQVFHVQTEDKGVDNPVIESLIYKGGEILGSRRLPYAGFLTDGYDEKVVTKLMEEQHRNMIDEIRRGRFDKPGLLADDTLLSDQSLDQVILNYLATSSDDGKKS